MSPEKTEYFISLLDDYLDGKLDDNVVGEIQEALKKDTFLNQVLEQHVQARANIRNAGEKELKAKFASNFEPIPEVQKTKNWKPLIAILLAIVLCTAAFILYTAYTRC